MHPIFTGAGCVSADGDADTVYDLLVLVKIH